MRVPGVKGIRRFPYGSLGRAQTRRMWYGHWRTLLSARFPVAILMRALLFVRNEKKMPREKSLGIGAAKRLMERGRRVTGGLACTGQLLSLG